MDYRENMFEHLLSRLWARRRQVGLGFALIAFMGASLTGYYLYRNYVSAQAHKAYAAALTLQKARVVTANEQGGLQEKTFTSEVDKWEAVALAFGDVFSKHPSIGCGTMAGAAQAQALIRLGRRAEARQVMAEVCKRAAASTFNDLYSVTHARMLLDSEEEKEVQAGVSLLLKIAANNESLAHDTALYFVGEYYWHTRDYAQAKNYWNQLLLHYQNDLAHPSPWVPIIEEKLALITA